MRMILVATVVGGNERGRGVFMRLEYRFCGGEMFNVRLKEGMGYKFKGFFKNFVI